MKQKNLQMQIAQLVLDQIYFFSNFVKVNEQTEEMVDDVELQIQFLKKVLNIS